MDATPSSTIVRKLKSDNLVMYLELTGWKHVNSDLRWQVFQREVNGAAEPFEVVLPSNDQAKDFPIFVANAINLLSGIRNESPEIMTRRIKYFDSDVLSIRNLETGEYDSITIKLADKQVGEIKQMIAYSASSEREPKPHFNTPLSAGNHMIEHYRFGHTFNGSFGFTIESPLTHTPYIYERKPQAALFDVEPYIDETLVIAPLERRVMERVARGLIYSGMATKDHSAQILVSKYSSGFNSNMCSAIVDMANQTLPLEYSILWSPKLRPSEDIEGFAPVKLNETSYDFLEQAAEELKTIQPEYVQIRGLVTDLSSGGDPLSDSDISRSVAIRWTNRPEGMKPIKVVVSLTKEDYVIAHGAHLSWSTVEVTGILQNTGALWRLIEPSHVEVTK